MDTLNTDKILESERKEIHEENVVLRKNDFRIDVTQVNNKGKYNEGEWYLVDKIEFSVVCLKWGTKYEPDYVNKLYGGVKKHLTVNFCFYCITDNGDNLESEIKVLSLESKFKGWMKKSILFSKHCKY